MAVALADDRVLFGIVTPTLVGLLVAGWNLGGKPLWYDETFEALLVMHPPLRFEIERQFVIEGDFEVPGLVVRLYVRPSAWSLDRRVPGVGGVA